MISNTKKITLVDIDAMNSGIRAYTLLPGDKNTIADYFGVDPRTPARWFANDGQQYRRMIPYPPATRSPFDKRVFKMFDGDDPEGFGDGSERRGAGKLQVMRLKCLLGAALGAGGLYRPNPLTTGEPKQYRAEKSTIDEALHYLNSVYTGNAADGEFLKRAWYMLTIEPLYSDTAVQNGWAGVVYFRLHVPGDPKNGGDGSDSEEYPADDEGDPELDADYDLSVLGDD